MKKSKSKPPTPSSLLLTEKKQIEIAANKAIKFSESYHFRQNRIKISKELSYLLHSRGKSAAPVHSIENWNDNQSVDAKCEDSSIFLSTECSLDSVFTNSTEFYYDQIKDNLEKSDFTLNQIPFTNRTNYNSPIASPNRSRQTTMLLPIEIQAIRMNSPANSPQKVLNRESLLHTSPLPLPPIPPTSPSLFPNSDSSSPMNNSPFPTLWKRYVYTDEVNNAATIITRLIRKHVYRKNYYSTIIQTLYRRYKQGFAYKLLKLKIKRIIRIIRDFYHNMVKTQIIYRKQKSAAVRLQRCYRKYHQICLWRPIVLKYQQFVKLQILQKWCRHFIHKIHRKRGLKKRQMRCILRIQRLYRGYCVRKLLYTWHSAQICIRYHYMKYFRRYYRPLLYRVGRKFKNLLLIKQIRKIQNFIRKYYIAKKAYGRKLLTHVTAYKLSSMIEQQTIPVELSKLSTQYLESYQLTMNYDEDKIIYKSLYQQVFDILNGCVIDYLHINTKELSYSKRIILAILSCFVMNRYGYLDIVGFKLCNQLIFHDNRHHTSLEQYINIKDLLSYYRYQLRLQYTVRITGNIPKYIYYLAIYHRKYLQYLYMNLVHILQHIRLQYPVKYYCNYCQKSYLLYNECLRHSEKCICHENHSGSWYVPFQWMDNDHIEAIIPKLQSNNNNLDQLIKNIDFVPMSYLGKNIKTIKLYTEIVPKKAQLDTSRPQTGQSITSAASGASTKKGSRPESKEDPRRPGSRKGDSRPQSRNDDQQRLKSPRNDDSRPVSRKDDSRPNSRKDDIRPQADNGDSRPGSPKGDSRPGSNQEEMRPMSPKRDIRPGSKKDDTRSPSRKEAFKARQDQRNDVRSPPKKEDNRSTSTRKPDVRSPTRTSLTKKDETSVRSKREKEDTPSVRVKREKDETSTSIRPTKKEETSVRTAKKDEISVKPKRGSLNTRKEETSVRSKRESDTSSIRKGDKSQRKK